MASEIKGEKRKLDRDEQKAVVEFVKMHEDEVMDGVKVTHLEGGRGYGSVDLLTLPNRSPSALKSDAESSSKHVGRHGNVLTFVAEQFNMVTREICRFLRDDKWCSMTASALAKAKVVCQSNICDMKETERVICAAGGSTNAMRTIRQEMAKKGTYFTSENVLRQKVDEEKKKVTTSTFRMELDGTHGPAECLVYVVNQMQLTVSIFENLLQTNQFVDWFGDGSIVISNTQDKGQGVSKHGEAFVNCKKPVAWYNVHTYLAVMPLRDDQKSKPNDNALNFAQTLPLVPWYGHIQHMVFVVVGVHVCLIPEQTKPVDGTFSCTVLKTSVALAAFKESAAVCVSGTPASVKALQDAPPNSATMVVYNDKYVGVMAGDIVAVTFTEPVPVRDENKPVIREHSMTITPDLLAGSDLTGLPGQSNVNSIFCRASGLANKKTRPAERDPKWGHDFKRAAAGNGPPLEPRTTKSVTEDYKTYLALKARGITYLTSWESRRLSSFLVLLRT